MIKKIIALSVLSSLLLMGGAFCIGAEQEEVITGVVSVKFLNIEVSDGSIDWGLLDLGAVIDTIQLGDSQTISNVGSVNVGIALKVDDTENWFYINTDTPAEDQFGYFFSFNGTSFIDFPIDNSYISPGLNLATDTSIGFDLRLFVPPSLSNGNLTQTITTTILATGG